MILGTSDVLDYFSNLKKIRPRTICATPIPRKKVVKKKTKKWKGIKYLFFFFFTKKTFTLNAVNGPKL